MAAPWGQAGVSYLDVWLIKAMAVHGRQDGNRMGVTGCYVRKKLNYKNVASVSYDNEMVTLTLY